MWIQDIFSAILNTNKTKHKYFKALGTNSALHCTWSPCIMCVHYLGGVQYHGDVQYHGGYHEYCGRISWVPWRVQYRGGYHDKCGDILSTVGGGVSTVGISWVLWGYLEYRGVILSTVGVFSTVGDIIMHMGDMMNTVGVYITVGGKIFCYLSTPQYWTPPSARSEFWGVASRVPSLQATLPPSPHILSVISDASCHTPYLFFKNTNCVAPPQIIFANLRRLSPKPSISQKLWFVVTVKWRDTFLFFQTDDLADFL